MKKSRKRLKFISLIILVVVIIAVIMAIAAKKSNIYAADPKFTDGGLTYTYTASTNTLKITGTAQSKGIATDVWKTSSELGMSSTTYKTIKKITTNAYVTGISASAFEGCTALTGFTMGANISSIGDSAFKGCTSLTKVEIGAAVTKIEQSAFEGCTELAVVTFKGSKVSSIGNKAFKGCIALKSITLKPSIQIIGDSAFEGCTSLGTGTGFVKFEKNSLCTTIGNKAFSGCTSLVNIQYDSKKNTLSPSITTIGAEAFSGCTNLAVLDLNTGVKVIGEGVFENCSPTLKITLRSTTPITYPISNSGKYKIELYGQSGFSSDSGGADGNRQIKGSLGSYLVGYMKINKNNTLTTKFYLAGKSYERAVKTSEDGATATRYGGIGGTGIGFELNKSGIVTAAASGGSGPCVDACMLRKELHGGHSGSAIFDPTIAVSWEKPTDGQFVGYYHDPATSDGHGAWWGTWLGRIWWTGGTPIMEEPPQMLQQTMDYGVMKVSGRIV